MLQSSSGLGGFGARAYTELGADSPKSAQSQFFNLRLYLDTGARHDFRRSEAAHAHDPARALGTIPAVHSLSRPPRSRRTTSTCPGVGGGLSAIWGGVRIKMYAARITCPDVS